MRHLISAKCTRRCMRSTLGAPNFSSEVTCKFLHSWSARHYQLSHYSRDLICQGMPSFGALAGMRTDNLLNDMYLRVSARLRCSALIYCPAIRGFQVKFLSSRITKRFTPKLLSLLSVRNSINYISFYTDGKLDFLLVEAKNLRAIFVLAIAEKNRNYIDLKPFPIWS